MGSNRLPRWSLARGRTAAPPRVLGLPRMVMPSRGHSKTATPEAFLGASHRQLRPDSHVGRTTTDALDHNRVCLSPYGLRMQWGQQSRNSGLWLAGARRTVSGRLIVVDAEATRPYLFVHGLTGLLLQTVCPGRRFRERPPQLFDHTENTSRTQYMDAARAGLRVKPRNMASRSGWWYGAGAVGGVDIGGSGTPPYRARDHARAGVAPGPTAAQAGVIVWGRSCEGGP